MLWSIRERGFDSSAELAHLSLPQIEPFSGVLHMGPTRPNRLANLCIPSRERIRMLQRGAR